jgi:hypothetical protein
MYEIIFSVTARWRIVKRKIGLFFATQAEKGGILGFNSGEILLISSAKGSIKTLLVQ